MSQRLDAASWNPNVALNLVTNTTLGPRVFQKLDFGYEGYISRILSSLTFGEVGNRYCLMVAVSSSHHSIEVWCLLEALRGPFNFMSVVRYFEHYGMTSAV